MLRRRNVLMVLAGILTAGIAGWHFAVPELGMLGWFVLGPLLWMVAERLFGELGKERVADRLERFHTGRCTRCGYDLRSSPERCPECGRPRERPEEPLPRITAKESEARWSEVAEVAWLMTLRGPSSGVSWRTDEERQIAEIIVRACSQAGCWPDGHFLPQDPFATMIEDWERMVWFGISMTRERELHIELTREDYDRFQAMTFEEVVKELAGRVGAGAVEETEKSAGRFVSSPGRIGLSPPADA